MAMEYDHLFKLVLVGDSGVGKSSLLLRFADGTFDDHLQSTIGVDFKLKMMRVGSKMCKVTIWDTAGQERFKSLRTPFYRGTDCCLLTFDVNDAQSFESLPMWKQEFLHYADVRDPDRFPFVLLGNKVDRGARVISEARAREWCAAHGNMPYYETSAKDNINVEQAFVRAAELLRRTEAPVKAVFTDTINLNKPAKSSCC